MEYNADGLPICPYCKSPHIRRVAPGPRYYTPTTWTCRACGGDFTTTRRPSDEPDQDARDYED